MEQLPCIDFNWTKLKKSTDFTVPLYRPRELAEIHWVGELSFKSAQGPTANCSLYLSLLAPRLLSFPFYHAASPVSSWKKSLPWRMDKRQLGHFRREKRAWAKVVRKHKVPRELFIIRNSLWKHCVYIEILYCAWKPSFV